MFTGMTEKEVSIYVNFAILWAFIIVGMIVTSIRIEMAERQARQERARRAQRDAASVKAQPQERHDV